MPFPENPSHPDISALLSRVFPQSQAEVVLARLVDPAAYLPNTAQPPQTFPGLDEEELAVLKAFRLPKRRGQWLTGRLCAKQAVVGYCRRYLPHVMVPAEGSLHVRNSQTGRPELRESHLPAELQHLDISITHSGDYAAAVACDSLGGIDIQEYSDTLERVKERFCRSEEEYLLKSQLLALDSLGRLTLLWAAKEAAIKALSSKSIPGFMDFSLERLEGIEDTGYVVHFRRDNQASLPAMPLQVAVTCFDNYALAVCLTQEARNA